MTRLSHEAAELQKQQRESAKHQQLMQDIVELLTARGPSDREDIALRLMVASAQRMSMALSDLGRAHRIQSKGSTYRIAGDKRTGIRTMTDLTLRAYKTRVPRDPRRHINGGKYPTACDVKNQRGVQ